MCTINLTDTSMCFFPAGRGQTKGSVRQPSVRRAGEGERTPEGAVSPETPNINPALLLSMRLKSHPSFQTSSHSSNEKKKKKYCYLNTHRHRQVSKYIKVACLYNLPLNGRQSTLVSCELRENAADEIDLPDVQVLHNPSFAPSFFPLI